MSFAELLSCSDEGDPLVQEAVMAYFGGLTDHNAHPVVDENAVADARSWMDFDAGEGATDLAEAAGEQF